MENRSFDHIMSRQNTEWVFAAADGGLARRKSSVRIYGFRELCKLLQHAGFERFEAYSSLSRDPFETGSPRLYLLAQKPITALNHVLGRSASPIQS